MEHRRAQPDGAGLTQRRRRRTRRRLVLERHRPIQTYEPFRRDHARRGSRSTAANVHFSASILIERRLRVRPPPATSISPTGPSRPTRSTRTSISRPRRTSSSTTDTFTVSGTADFTGRSICSRPSGTGASSRARSRARSPASTPGGFRICAARCCGCRIGSRSPNATSALYGGTARFDYRLAPLGARHACARATGTSSTRTSISRS